MDARLINHNGAMTISINGVLHPLTTFKLRETGDDNLFHETVRSTVAEVARRDDETDSVLLHMLCKALPHISL